MLKSFNPAFVILMFATAFGSANIGRATEEKPSCAFVQMINNFKYVDDRTAIFETGPSRRFKVTFFNSCRELKWAETVRVEAHPGVCLEKGDVVVIGRVGFVPERCFIDKIEALPAQ